MPHMLIVRNVRYTTDQKINGKLRVASEPCKMQLHSSGNTVPVTTASIKSDLSKNHFSSFRRGADPRHYDPLAPLELQRHSEANTLMKKPRALECQRPLFLVFTGPRTHNTLLSIVYSELLSIMLDLSTVCLLHTRVTP